MSMSFFPEVHGSALYPIHGQTFYLVKTLNLQPSSTPLFIIAIAWVVGVGDTYVLFSGPTINCHLKR